MATDEMVIKWSLDSTQFNEGLTQINKSMNLVKSSFKASDSSLKNYGSSLDQLKNKQKYLSDTMTLQKQKIDSLRASYEKQKNATGENSTATQNLGIKLNNAVAYYNKLQGELKETTTELKKQNEEISKQNSTWGKLTSSMQGFSKKMSSFGSKLSDIGGKMTKTFTVPIVAGFAAATKGTEELRLDMSKLEQNAISAGVSFDLMKGKLSYLTAITGESDSSVEALSNLLSSGFNSSQMEQAINNIAGAVVKFPDTLKIESLADSMQETLATGAATGQYSELISRLGINTDEFAEGLTRAKEAGTAQQYVLDVLTNKGMADLNTAYYENNKTMIDSAMAQHNLTMKFADLGEKLTPILTKITEFGTKIADVFLNLSPQAQDMIIKVAMFVAALGPVLSIVSKIPLIINPIGLIITGIAAITAGLVILYNKCEGFRNFVNGLGERMKNSFIMMKIQFDVIVEFIKNKVEFIKNTFFGFIEFFKNGFTTDWAQQFGVLGNILNAWFSSIGNYIDGVKQVFSGIVDFIAGVFTGDWSRAWEGVKGIFAGIFNSFGALIKAPLNGVIGLLNMAIDGINSLNFDVPDWVPGIGGKNIGFDLGHINYLYEGGIVDKPTLFGGNTVIGDSYKGMGRQKEAIIPLDEMYRRMRSIVSQESKASGQTVIYTTNVFQVDGKELTKTTTKKVIETIDRKSTNYQKLKGYA